MRINEIVHYVINFIFPKHCIVCDELLPFGSTIYEEHICEKCTQFVEFIKEPTCIKCGAMINDDNETYCQRCKIDNHKNFEYGFGLVRYNDYIKKSLHRIKYSGRKEYIEFYGKSIAKVYKNRFEKINADCLVPVPIHKNRLIKRNYNQAKVLADSIHKELNKNNISIPVNDNIVFRIKNTKALNKLDNIDRAKELDSAFFAPHIDNIEKVILVDDILTTSATIDKIAEVLKKSGVKKVYFVCIAIVDNL